MRKFTLTRAEIIAFATRFDPQPFHLDETAAASSYFGTLVASGLHTQAAAIGLVVRRLADLVVVAGGALHEARFLIPVRPDQRFDVSAQWTRTRASARDPSRGVASISISVRDALGQRVAALGITYILARRPA